MGYQQKEIDTAMEELAAAQKIGTKINPIETRIINTLLVASVIVGLFVNESVPLSSSTIDAYEPVIETDGSLPPDPDLQKPYDPNEN